MEYLRTSIGLGASGVPSDYVLSEARTFFDAVALVFPKNDPNFNSSLPWPLGGNFASSCIELMKYPSHAEWARENIRDYAEKIVKLLLIQG